LSEKGADDQPPTDGCYRCRYFFENRIADATV